MILIEEYFPGMQITEQDAEQLQTVESKVNSNDPRARRLYHRSVTRMRYLVTDDFVAAHGWTPDKIARALEQPLANIGVLVERVRSLGDGGFQSPGLGQ
jgi:hypothetical protein